MIRIVSFLGLGPRDASPPYYKSVSYRSPDDPGACSSPTPLVQAALGELFAPVSHHFLVTPAVRERWLGDDALLLQYLPEAQASDVDGGATEEERWKTFDRVRGLLSPEALAGEAAPPDEIFFDVTHGFRLQPMLALAAIAFQQAEWVRTDAPDPPPIRLLYGAFEAQEGGVAPIWDLTLFLDASRWNAAFDALFRYGRADDLEALGQDVSKRALAAARTRGARGPELAVEHYPKKLATTARAWADDLALARTGSILKASSGKLAEQLSHAHSTEWAGRLPVLKPLLENADLLLGDLASSSVISEEGVNACVHLAKLYGRLQRYGELIATLRESAITRFGLSRNMPCPEPGTSGTFKEQRDHVERAWNAWIMSEETKPGSAPDERAVSFRRLGNDRNDIEHAGYKPDPLSAQVLRDRVTNYPDAFTGILTSPLEFPATSTGRLDAGIVNLSSHPVSGWSGAQLAEARSLGFGDPVDWPASLVVAPTDPTSSIAEAAGSIAAAVARDYAAACVQGEHTLTYALVRALKCRGVRCFAATTERHATEEIDADGAVHRHHLFRFVAWREYP